MSRISALWMWPQTTPSKPRARLGGERLFERGDVADGILDLVFQKLGQRPVGQAEASAQRIEMVVETQRQGVEPIAEVGEPLGVLHDAVEQVAMDHQQSQAERGAMYLLAANRDAAECEVEKMTGGFVVVAGDVDDLGALARLAQDLLHDVVVRLLPVPAAPQLPAVDDVADEVEVIRFGAPQKLEQAGSLAAGRPQMGIRDPDSPESLHGGGRRVHCRLRKPRSSVPA